MMDEEVFLPISQIKGESELLISAMKNKEEIGSFLLFWDIRHEHAFDFCAVSWVRGSGEPTKRGTEDDELYRVVVQGVAYFDGIRHIRFFPGSDCGSGYDCYPNVKDLAALLSRLREIEVEVCRPGAFKE